jgi:hypothetical protein
MKSGFHWMWFAGVLAGGLQGCALTDVGRSKSETRVAVASVLKSCEDLATKFQFEHTRIESTVRLAPSTVELSLQPGGPRTPYVLGTHCRVLGKMHERKGSDGQDYAIGFEMRLPEQWNGRFYYQANGGIDGVVHPALGALGGGPTTGALAQGFAVISSDAGHTGRQNPRFGAEPTARKDYGYGAVGKLTPMAKALITQAYGRQADRSYIGGCSNGGRHTLVAASRYAHEYDGYLAGAPGYRLPHAALAQLWGASKWRSLADPGATVAHPFSSAARLPDLGTALTAQERQTVAQAIVNRCDALDGARDGLVQDVVACQATFDLQRDVPLCTGPRGDQCLSAPQKAILAQVMAGARTSSGERIYAAFPWDPGISAGNWARWKFVNALVLDPAAAGYIFMSPPRSIDPFNLDVDSAYRAITMVDTVFGESADVTVAAPSKDDPASLTALRARGGKVLLYHGVSDAVFSETDTRAWTQRVHDRFGPAAQDFVRYFPVPGMAHCSGGPATDHFDALSALVAWVEQGVAPTSILARSRGAGHPAEVNTELPRDWNSRRSRPLCAYPRVAHYDGKGDIEDAASFSCR